MRLRIAALSIELHEPAAVLTELDQVYAELDERGAAYAHEPANPHLCKARCSSCCQRGAFFALTLVEAVRWTQGVAALPEMLRHRARREANRLLALQEEVFGRAASLAADEPGARDEASFTVRVAAVARTGPACPLLEDDLCSTYEARPFLCRAYGFPVDAFAVETESAIAFRSLCHLYAGHELRDFVRGRDLRDRLAQLSSRLAGGQDVGRFTSAEAILAQLED